MLEKIDDTGVFQYFEEISKIPRGSGNTDAISAYLVAFAKKHQLRYRQEDCGNVIIWKDASVGCEAAPTTMLQGHMDMVCEKESSVEHDFKKDPLQLRMNEQYIWAEGTTLGGDDGIAIAYALAILADSTIQHPALEVVITIDEETGMDGAIALETEDLKSKYFINLDSEEEGVLLTSCAGGMSVNGTFPIERQKKTGYVVSLRISGLQGGHSGTEIDKNRENAVLLQGRILHCLQEAMEEKTGTGICLVELQGGKKDNAIPRDAESLVLVNHPTVASAALEEINEMLKCEMIGREPNIKVEYEVETTQSEMEVVDLAYTKEWIFFLNHVPNGVQKYSAVIPGLVESSLNLGICETKENMFYVSFSIRSSLQSYKAYIASLVKEMIVSARGRYEEKSAYSAWEYKVDSTLRSNMIAVYEEQYGVTPKVEAIHAGVECGILSGKMPELDMVSIGPDILDIHTPKEKMDIASAQRVYEYLKAVLRKICENN